MENLELLSRTDSNMVQTLRLTSSFYGGVRDKKDERLVGNYADIVIMDFNMEDISLIYCLSPRFNPFKKDTYFLDGLSLSIARNIRKKEEVIENLKSRKRLNTGGPRTSGEGVIIGENRKKILSVLYFLRNKEKNIILNDHIKKHDTNGSTLSMLGHDELSWFCKAQLRRLNLKYWGVPFYFVLKKGLELLDERPIGLIDLINREITDSVKEYEERCTRRYN